MKKGQVLGRVYPASLLTNEDQKSHDEGQEVFLPSLRQLSSAPQNQEGESQNVMDTAREDKLLAAVHLDQSTLKEEQHQQLEALLREYADVFALDSSELGSTDVVTHTINTVDHPPIHQQARRMPFALRDQIDEMVQGMLAQGVIEPSQSPCSSPVLLVKKKDRSHRFCVDYLCLNSITKMDVFPLPWIDDSLDLLSRAKFFTILDLMSGYWQVKMLPESKENTAFTTWSTPSPLTPSPLSQIQQLLYLMQSGVVTNSIESLISVWPKEGETSILLSPPSRDMKRLSMWRKSAMMGGGKCNCGKCLKCNPSPSGVCVILAFVTGVGKMTSEKGR